MWFSHRLPTYPRISRDFLVEYYKRNAFRPRFGTGTVKYGLVITHEGSLGKREYLVQPNHRDEVVHLGRYTWRLFKCFLGVRVSEVLVITIRW